MALKKKKASRKPVKKAVKKRAKKAVKKTVKKALKKKPAGKKQISKKKPAAAKQQSKIIGEITHYFPHVQAAVIKLNGPLVTGEIVKIQGHTTDLNQTVTSMQIDRVAITTAKKGDEIGLQVASRVRQGDKVYKL